MKQVCYLFLNSRDPGTVLCVNVFCGARLLSRGTSLLAWRTRLYWCRRRSIFCIVSCVSVCRWRGCSSPTARHCHLLLDPKRSAPGRTLLRQISDQVVWEKPEFLAQRPERPHQLFPSDPPSSAWLSVAMCWDEAELPLVDNRCLSWTFPPIKSKVKLLGFKIDEMLSWGSGQEAVQIDFSPEESQKSCNRTVFGAVAGGLFASRPPADRKTLASHCFAGWESWQRIHSKY